ncbi:MAG: ABC transporter ATP-binding protein [Bacteroidetes bacterium]|nr:MAG: ABC transporter ATP-binding protein [Bacteroidota bacterium]
MPLPLLQINNLAIEFQNGNATTSAVNKISFSLDRGELLAIVGESGSGKSVTALSVLRLLQEPPAKYKSGEIIFSEDGISSQNLLVIDYNAIRKIRGNKISMIFQEPMTSLNPVFTCGHQVMEAIAVHRKLRKSEMRKKVVALFEKTGLPDPDSIYDRYPHQLSGGQKQRVMIAMAMCCEPALLIADEPTTALDVTVQQNILQLIRDLQKERNMGVIFITHDLGLVREIADKVVVMYKGNIVEQGNTESVFKQPQHAYTKALLACRPILHSKSERLPVVSDFLGEIPKTEDKKISRQDAEDRKVANILKVENLGVWYPARKNFFGKPLDYMRAVDDVSFVVNEGETLGLVGESGSGKTTLGRAILRLIPINTGKVIYGEKDLTVMDDRELRSFRKDLQIIFQDPYSSLNPRISIGDAIAEPMRTHKLFQSERQRKEKVVDLLEKVNLKADHFSRYPHEFSGGQRQRICIARALALNPGFIICDESVSALDVSVQAQVLNLLNDLKNEFQFTSIFISHDLAVVHYISDRIMVMQRGKIVESGTADEIFYNPKIEYTQKLLDSMPGKSSKHLN